MKWDKDPLKYEKYLLYDGIIQFSKMCDGKDFGDISIRDLSNFIDKFFQKHNLTEDEL